MSSRVAVRLMGVLVDLSPFLEPFVPPFVSYYLSRQLSRWKDLGLISSYSRSVRRLGRLHYEASIDVELTQKQLDRIMRQEIGGRVWRR
ncbi:hypothetical protein MUP00_07820 [Candidatus Bathyarchaeota archaeon]|nr:hypothetical protein [Candidatus Bathyarchaeota archaeon]